MGRQLRTGLISAVMLATGVTPSHAAEKYNQCEPAPNSYHCLISDDTPRGFVNVMHMTYCYGAGTYHDRITGRDVFDLPQQFYQYVEYGADEWSTTPGLAVNITGAGRCAKSDQQAVWVYGFHGKAYPNGDGRVPVGYEVCLEIDHGQCLRALLAMSVDRDPAKQGTKIGRTGVHEFGHALGLAHPCDNTCANPVMSYGSCTADRCITEPNYDDVVGVQLIYGWHDTGGGCDLMVQRPDAVQPHLEKPDVPDTANTPAVDAVLNAVPALGATVASVVEDVDIDDDSLAVGVGGLVSDATRLAGYGTNAGPYVDGYGGTVNGELGWALQRAGLGVSNPDLSMPVRCLT